MRCTKIPHPSYTAAEKQRTSLRRRRKERGRLSIYWCAEHRAYHVGH